MYCTKCGTRNSKEARFCKACGKMLEGPNRHLRQKGALPRLNRKVAVAAGTMLILGLAAMALLESGPRSSTTTAQVPRPQFSRQVLDVAEKFLCSCGNCQVLELAQCTCPEAIEEKQLIEEELNQGTPEKEVIKLVNERYGRIKGPYPPLEN